jgi:hypothetical protein
VIRALIVIFAMAMTVGPKSWFDGGAPPIMCAPGQCPPTVPSAH